MSETFSARFQIFSARFHPFLGKNHQKILKKSQKIFLKGWGHHFRTFAIVYFAIICPIIPKSSKIINFIKGKNERY